MKPIVLMCAKTQSALADRLLAILPGLIPARMRWADFESGNPDFVIQDVDRIRRAHVVFIADASTPTHAVEQWTVLRAMQYYQARSLTVFIPYFPGTLDRVDVPGRIAWAKSAAMLFSNIPSLHGSGPARIVIYDIHSLQEEHFFTDQVANDFHTAMPFLVDTIRRTWPFDALAYPDKGAKDRFEKKFPDIPAILCDKTRMGDDRVVVLKEGDPRDKRVLLVDDLIISGGTLSKCAEVMMRMGAQEVRAVSPHLVVPTFADALFTTDGPITRLYVSDSVPTGDLVLNQTFEPISLAPLIAQDIKDNVGV